MSLPSQSALTNDPEAVPGQRVTSQARERLVWPPPTEDLDDVALVQFPSELPTEPAAGHGRATSDAPVVLPASPTRQPATASASYSLEDFPRVGQARPSAAQAPAPEAGRFGTARWVLALVAVLIFAALMGAPRIMEAGLTGPLPVLGPAPAVPPTSEPYRPPPIDEIELQTLH